jgi:inosine-uridine nucleoside N-ribohydrolase
MRREGAWLLTSQVDQLRMGDALCRELARQVDIFSLDLHGGRGVVPPDYACLLHDPLAVACAVDRRFVTTERLRVTAAMHQGHVRTFVDPAAGQEAEVVRSVDTARFAEYWLATVLA